MTFIRCCLVVFTAFFTGLASAQTGPVFQRDRVAARPDLGTKTRLRGHVPAWVTGANDRGTVPDETPLQLTFVLSRSPEVQASFEQLLADQQNPESSSYHRWLTPQEVGEQYGPTQHDVDALINWLASQGLPVMETSPSRMFVSVAAPAAAVSNALGTSFHQYDAQGKLRVSAVDDPAIPTAFAAVVGSIAGLANVGIRPMHHEVVTESAKPDGGVSPRVTTSGGSHFLGAGDFSTIFNLKPAYSAGFTGTGQKVAIIGRSRVATADITAFESNSGLATNLPNVVIPTTGVDPGTTGTGDQAEATLDVERVVATAPGAQVDLVVSSSTGGSDGVTVAALYEVQTLLDPVMTISFGSCETFNGPAGVRLWDALFSQAASEGITAFVSSGDSGADTCDQQFSTVPAYQFRSINVICSSSYTTCVGGTELVDTSNPGLYWSSSNGAGGASALSYIPEGAWNEPLSSNGTYIAIGGGGGASVYVPKPSWQAGTGVPPDGARDVPDISFPSAGHDAYYSCYSVGGGSCANGSFQAFYGTSAAAPSMAGVAALLNQKMGGPQGNMNPLLYKLAASSPSAFHDATVASSGVVNCSVNVASICNNSTPGQFSTAGGAAGYVLTAGYDQATGLGSLDVANFLNAASSVAKTTLAAAALTVTESASVISNTQTVVFTATFVSKNSTTPGGTVQFYANTNPIGVPVAVVSGRAVTAPLPITAAGSYLISATYSGDATYAPTTAPGISLTVNGLTALTNVTASVSTIQIGSTATFTASVLPSTFAVFPTGTVRFSIPGSTNDSYVAIVPLVGGVATTPAIRFSKLGSYSLIALYQGDGVYSPSNSAVVPITVQKLISTSVLTAPAGNIGIGGIKGYSDTIVSSVSTSIGAPTGTVQLYANGIPIGNSFNAAAIASTILPATFSSAGTYSITSVYSGDANYLPSTSSPVSLTVVSTPASYTLTATLPTLTVTGQGNSTAGSVGISAALGFSGLIALKCAVTYNGTATGVVPPTCTLGPALQTVTVNMTETFVAVQVATVAPRRAGGSVLSVRGGHPGFSWSASKATEVCALLLCFVPWRRRSWRSLALVLLMATGFGMLTGCGSNLSGAASPGTTSGSYTLTITATTTVTGTPVPAPVTIPLTVQ